MYINIEKKKDYYMSTDITVGIPTYRRPDLLERAIESVLNQTYKNIFINISVDYHQESDKEYKKLQNKYLKYKNIKFNFQKINIGSLENFFYLSKNCNTDYFMWLADDDEMSSSLVASLKKKLISSADIVCSCPFWVLKKKDKEKNIKPITFESNNLLNRIFNYLKSNDDVFFYGLHKSKILKEATFEGYWWPNKKNLANWAYVLQFDILLKGRICLVEDENAKWINHDYGEKYYVRSIGKSLFKYLAYVMRRINVYFYYIKKCFLNKNIFLSFLIIFASLLFFFRDIIFGEPIYKKINF